MHVPLREMVHVWTHSVEDVVHLVGAVRGEKE